MRASLARSDAGPGRPRCGRGRAGRSISTSSVTACRRLPTTARGGHCCSPIMTSSASQREAAERSDCLSTRRCAPSSRSFGPRSSASISACPSRLARPRQSRRRDRHQQRHDASKKRCGSRARRRCRDRARLRGGRPHRPLPRLRPGRSDRPVCAASADRRCGPGAGDRRGRNRRRPRDCRGLRAWRQRRPARHRLSPRARSADQRCASRAAEATAGPSSPI